LPLLGKQNIFTFDKLITSLRTAVAEENILDKECTSYADIFDAYRLSLKNYQFITKEVKEDLKKIKTR
jgi:phosphotransferase system IIB component